MQGEQVKHEWSVPEDAVYERAPILGHDQLIRPTTSDSLRLEGEGSKGEIVEYLHVDENDGKFYHEMKQDIEPCLKRVREMCLDGGSDAGKNKSRDFYHAMHVEPIVIYAWLNKRGLTMKDFKNDVLDQFIDDPDNSAFRIWKGKV